MTSLSETSMLAGAAGQSTGFTIGQSIRFNKADSAYISRTVSSAGNQRTFTISWWWKFGLLGSLSGAAHQLWNSYADNNNRFSIMIDNDVGSGAAGDKLCIFNNASGTTQEILETNRLFRDPSAWYHFVVTVDTTQATKFERVRLYVNGERESNYAESSMPAQNYQMNWNAANLHLFGKYGGGTSNNADGYMAECNHIDGTALGPENFGEFKEDTNIWIPKKYTGSYGTNGFRITGETNNDLGKNVASGNTFATYASTNLATNDQRADTPTNNQITFNPLNNQQSGGTLTNGNLEYTGPSTRTNISLTANIPATGKWAVAFKATDNSNDEWNMGITKATNTNFGDAAGSNEAIGGQDNDGIQFLPSSNDASLYNYIGSAAIDPSLPITTSDEFWMAVDMGTGKCFLGIYDASATAMKFVAADAGIDGNPATGDNPTITISDMIGSLDYAFAVNSKSTNVWTLLRSTEVSGTTPTGYTYFENVKDLL